MSTPSNSVLNRENGDVGLLSQLVYENESLKIEVEALREKVQLTGPEKLEELRVENESLKGEVARLSVRLSEKSNQLEQYTTSSDRFANIDQSLHELLTQIQTQRAELAEMRDSTREKDATIAELKLQLAQSEAAASEAVAQATAASAAAAEIDAQAAEHAQLRGELMDANAELNALRRGSDLEVAELRSRLTEAQEALLARREEAASQPRADEAPMTSEEHAMSECREREAATQRQLVDAQATIEALRSECSQLREENAALTRAAQNYEQQLQLQQQQQQQHPYQQQQRVEGVDIYSPEVKAHVDKIVQRATEGLDRRLREQVEQNASLLSRMALVQQESEAMMKTKGMSTHEVTVMKERVDMRSRQNNARSTMQRRVAELLSNEQLSKEDIELLLQEMLDYQEETEQESRSMLLVKDLEAEEKERTLRMELKRVKDENASLMKQLQRYAVEGFQRDRSNMAGGGNANESAPSTADTAADGAGPGQDALNRRRRSSVSGATGNADETAAMWQSAPSTPGSNAWSSGAPGSPSPFSVSPAQVAGAGAASGPAVSGPQSTQRPGMPQHKVTPLTMPPQNQYAQQQQSYPPNPSAHSPRSTQQPYGGDRRLNPQPQYQVGGAQYKPGSASTATRGPTTPSKSAGHTDPHVRFASNPAYAPGGAGSSSAAVGGREEPSINMTGGKYGTRLQSGGSSGATAPAGGSGASPGARDPNSNVIVQCAVCTLKQPYGNRKCEICEAPLQLR